jgi:hypothetical protein
MNAQAILKISGLRRAGGTNRKMFSHWEGVFPTEELPKSPKLPKIAKD